MHKLCLIERYSFCIKTSNPHIFRDFIERFTLKRKSFHGLENASVLDHCPFYTKTEIFDFVLFHLYPNTNTKLIIINLIVNLEAFSV